MGNSPKTDAAVSSEPDITPVRMEGAAWETTDLHVLHGPDPVFSWFSGTGLQPVLQSLPDDLRARFEQEVRTRLRVAYPDVDGVVVMPFRRVFVVVHVA